MAQELRAWVNGIPPESEIESRIDEIEGELELLRVALKQVRAHGGEADKSAPSSEPAAPSQNGALSPEAEALRGRLSDARLRIMRAILSQRSTKPTIPEIVAAVDPDDRKNTESNLHRMVTARLLTRAGRGRYRLTPAAAELVRSLDASAGDP
jgi:hypothetical protein